MALVFARYIEMIYCLFPKSGKRGKEREREIEEERKDVSMKEKEKEI